MLINEAINYSAIIILILIGLGWLIRKYISSYIKESVSYTFNERIENLRAELSEKQQKQQQLHELLIKTFPTESKEITARRIIAIDSLWKSFFSYRKFRTAVDYLAILNFDIIKQKHEDQNVIEFLNSFPLTSLKELKAELMTQKDNPSELTRPWITHKTWALYLAYTTIIYYSIHQFESAKMGGILDSIYDENRMLEILRNALPDQQIHDLNPICMKEIADLLEFSLINELKLQITTKEDEAAVTRAKKIFTYVFDNEAKELANNAPLNLKK